MKGAALEGAAHEYRQGRSLCYGRAYGGYGNQFERDPQKVADDVLDGVISPVTALKDYGVVVSAKGVVDAAATDKARASRARPR